MYILYVKQPPSAAKHSFLIPKAGIYIPAFADLLKSLAGLAFIAIYFPAAGALAVFPFISDKPNHVSQRIAQKEPDFMRKGIAFLEPFFQPSQTVVHAGMPVAIAGKKRATPVFFRSACKCARRNT